MTNAPRLRVLLLRKGNPLGIHSLTDVARAGARIALPDAVDEAGSRARYRAAVDQLIGKSAADAFLAAEVLHFQGRIGIVHRDFPEMVARGYADVALTQYHLISYWTRIFPNHFDLVPVSGGRGFFSRSPSVAWLIHCVPVLSGLSRSSSLVGPERSTPDMISRT
jgi:hypothetical protein